MMSMKRQSFGVKIYIPTSDDVYQNAAQYCVMFVSQHYADKLWTNHERQSAQARAFKENKEYVLPARFDDTIIPGLRDTVGYIDLRITSPSELAKLIANKVGVPRRSFYLPPVPDRLFERLGITTTNEKTMAVVHAHRFLSSLKRMSPDERKVIVVFFLAGCPDELPENIHIELDLLRRHTGFPISKLKRLLGALQSLGFYCVIRDSEEDDGLLGSPLQVAALEWHHTGTEYGGNATVVANEMILGVAEDFCEHHANETLERLDFSNLASVTSVEDTHTTKANGAKARQRSSKSKRAS